MTNFITLLRKNFSGLERYPASLLVAWLVVMLSLPLLQIIFGQQALLQGLALAVLLQVAFVLNVLNRAWGWWSTLRTTLGLVLLTWAVQAIVLRSGLPYGDLHYTTLLQPQVLDVPLLIPLIWLMMLPPAWAIARVITHKLSGCLMRLAFIAVSALAFTAWGFYFDPLMVHLGLMEWNPVGGYYGSPWLNLFGWLVVSGVITFGVSPKRLPGGRLVLIYGISWLVEFFTLLLFWGLPGAALAGFCLMGGMLLWAGIVTR
jgi:putative membrane protein